MTSRAYVFVDGLEDKPIICGVVEQDSDINVGKFRYGNSYLSREDAFPLDPLHLPLINEQMSTRLNKGMSDVLLDAGPDSWGKKLIHALHTTKPKNDVELLLAGAGMGVGALTFSLSQTASKPKRNKNTIGDVPVLLKGKAAILADDTIPNEAKKAFNLGSSMGGARPKTIIEDSGKSFIAKFNKDSDLFNVCRVEHASMAMLAELKDLHVRVADTQVMQSENEDILLVERFDCADSRPTHHFLSANALINQRKVNEYASKTTYCYGALAEFNMKYGAEPYDAHELFARMVFNILLGNTDDHSRNHAFVYSLQEQHWRLSKAYDVLPINNTRQHGIGIGEFGRIGSIENALSQSQRFGLKRPKAQKVINEIQALTIEWPHYFKHHGVSSTDIEILRSVIPK